MIRAFNLSKTFTFPQKRTLFSEFSLSIDPGESLAILGKSGVGKTTLLHILGTLEEPTEGQLFLNNTKVSSRNAAKLRSEHIGFVFQSFNLLEDFSLLDNILMPAKIARREIKQEYGLHLLEQVGLADKAASPAKLLSGGEKQRAAIARALCNDPSVILADEPSGNLDAHNVEVIATLLSSLVTHKQKALILVTHDPSLALICQKQIHLN